MNKSIFLYTWNEYSEGASNLSKELGIRRIRRRPTSLFKPTPSKTVINWGCSELPGSFKVCRIINKPHSVRATSNKMLTFNILSSRKVRVPQYTELKAVALTMLQDGRVVLARTKLNGHGGEGIVIVERPEDLVDAPLYVAYVKKQDEFRVHFCGSSLVAVQRKARNREIPDERVNWKVRNHDNGFVFVHTEKEEAPLDVIVQSTEAFRTLELDFGAVDVIWNAHEGKAYVLEINSAPGMEGRTVTLYAEAFRKLLAVSATYEGRKEE